MRRADDPELKHVLELSFGSLKSVGSQWSRTCRNGWSYRLDVVFDVVLHKSVWSSDLRRFGKLRRELEIGVQRVEGGAG